jgi:PAS domain S-box-containing protein
MLSARDSEILSLMWGGITDTSIAARLGMSLSRLEARLGRLSNRFEGQAAATPSSLLYERAMRKRATNSMIATRARFSALLDAMPSAVLVVNARTGMIRQMNGSADELFGYAKGELIGHSVEILVPDKFKPIHPAYRIGFLSSVRKREMGYHPPIFAKRADGQEIEMAIALTASISDDDVMVVCSDYSSWAGSRRISEETSVGKRQV